MNKKLLHLAVASRLRLMLILIAIIGLAPVAFGQAKYIYCSIRIPNAGDPIVNGYQGPPAHYYLSETFSEFPGGEQNYYAGALKFFEWVKKGYSGSWMWNSYAQNYGENPICSSATIENWRQFVASMKATPNSVVTMTTWPATY